MNQSRDPFNAKATLKTPAGDFTIYRLDALEKAGLGAVSKLPKVIKILLESALRNFDGFAITENHVKLIAGWSKETAGSAEVPYMPSRVILQDFTGVPAVVDLAALRNAMQRMGGDPQRINPQVDVDLVIDHSVQVDAFGSVRALDLNNEREFERNRERYEFLHWGQKAFKNFRVVPPASGIVHQVNLEYLAHVIANKEIGGETFAFPDSLVGTDSHTTMINGIGVLGWGVGGIEAEAVMLGQPIFMLLPDVVGVELKGQLPEGATATDLVLRVTEMLRKHGVVDKLVEFYGEGVDRLSLADRATIANMAPEYGATTGFFPVDNETLNYMRQTGRDENTVALVEAYCKEQGLWRTGEVATYSENLSLDMGTIVPSLAGPKRPQDRVPLDDMKRNFYTALTSGFHKPVAEPSPNGDKTAKPRRDDTYKHSRAELAVDSLDTFITHGSVVIAAITSCTNTSNPSVLVAAGLLAKKAVEAGLQVKPWVKTSMAPGSRVVTRYLDRAGLSPYLQALRFHTVGYGCTTCIGNSGPLPDPVAKAITENDLVVASVLSGNRNFEGRVNPLTKANYLASPPLVVAYAIAGTVDIDMSSEPLGIDPAGAPVYLKDIWPTQAEIRETMGKALDRSLFEQEYGKIFTGNEKWNAIPSATGSLYAWDDQSTYIAEPPFFKDLTADVPPLKPIAGARVLALLGDSITTDHISPAGSIAVKSPAGEYLQEHGVTVRDFNSYGSRRGHHDVMMRGTFANIRLKNQLVPGTEGGITKLLPEGDVTSIYDAAMKYQERGTPLVILAGKEYGTGSSRDWAAKGTYLLGVRAVIAESFERIHRSNLVFMGVLPMEFTGGASWQSLGLTGAETFDIELADDLKPQQTVKVTAHMADGSTKSFDCLARVDSDVEIRYLKNSGILHTVLRDMAKQNG